MQLSENRKLAMKYPRSQCVFLIQGVGSNIGCPSRRKEKVIMNEAFRSTEWYRRNQGKMVAGVAAGLAETFGLPLAFVRLIFIFWLFLGGGGLIAYLACWLVMPVKDPAPKPIVVHDDTSL